MARCARSSVAKPMPTLSTRTAPIATTSATSPVAAATAAAATRRRTSTLRSCPTRTAQAEAGGVARNTLGPWRARRRAASDSDSPESCALSASSASAGDRQMPGDGGGRLG